MAPATFACVFVAALGAPPATFKGSSCWRWRDDRRRAVVCLRAEDSISDLQARRSRMVQLVWLGDNSDFNRTETVFGTALASRWRPHNLLWCFIGVLIGNMVGVLPGMGRWRPYRSCYRFTFGMKPVAQSDDRRRLLRRTVWRRDLLDFAP